MKIEESPKIEESKVGDAVGRETLLHSLNEALFRLRAAAVDLQDKTIDARVVKVLQRTKPPEIIGDHRVVAVAGAQGAGKTTLIREIYGLDGTWLDPNAGPGERVPVMVLEDATEKSTRGWAMKINGASVTKEPIEPDDFKRSLLDGLTDHRLVLGLTVPATLFGVTGRGFLLLPGYESSSPADEEWQSLMRQAMVAAPTVLVVVDRELLKSDAQHPIMADLREEYGQGALPIVVISKTERLNIDDPERVELQERAAEVFALVPEHERIVMTGRGNSVYRDLWLPKLREVLLHALPSNVEMRRRTLNHLRDTVRHDVRDLSDHVHNAAYGEPDGEDNRTYREGLEHFDDARREAVAEYTHNVRRELDRHRQHAYLLVDKVIERRSKRDERIRQLTEYIKGRGHVHYREREREFESCWHRAGDGERGFATGHLRATAGAIETLRPLVRESLDVAIFTDLMALGKGESTAPGHRFSENLMRHIRLLPLMVLEALRTAMEAPQMVGVRPTTLTPDHATREPDAAKVLREIGEERLAMLAGFGALLGIDVLHEGRVVSPPELAARLRQYLFGGVQLTSMSRAAIEGLARLVSVAGLAAAAVNYVNRLSWRQASAARQIIDAIYEEHQKMIEEEFVRLLQQLRRQIEFSLRRRLNLDARMARAIEIDLVLQR